MLRQHLAGAAVQKRQHVIRTEGGEQDARVLLNDAQGGVIIAAPAVGVEGVEILPPRLVPHTVALPVCRLPLRR